VSQTVLRLAPLRSHPNRLGVSLVCPETLRSPAMSEIDWNTTRVKDGTLSVQVGGARDLAWDQALLQCMHKRPVALPRWGTVRFSANTITVDRVEPGGAATLREHLDAIVADANEAHAARQAREAEERKAKAEAAERQAEADARLEAEFRGLDDSS